MSDRLHTISECVATGGTIRCKPWLRWNEGDWYWACCHPDLNGHLAIAAGAPPPPECPLRRGQDIVQIDPELLGQEEIARKLGEEPPLHAGHGKALRGKPLRLENTSTIRRFAEEMYDLAATAWQLLRDRSTPGSAEHHEANAVCDQLLEGGRLWLPRDPLPPSWPWIDVTDRLPADGTEALVLTIDGERRVAAYNASAAKANLRSCWRRADGKRWSSPYGDFVDRVTYFKVACWMPLPDVPAPPRPPGESVRPGGFVPPEGGP